MNLAHRRQPNFFIDPRFKSDKIPADALYGEEESFEEKYHSKRHSAPKDSYDFYPASNPEYKREKHLSKRQELLKDERRVEELAAPIVDKRIHEVEGQHHDVGSEPSSASIYSEGFSQSSASRSVSSSSSQSSSQSSSSSGSSTDSS